jgi:hypothetical protein
MNTFTDDHGQQQEGKFEIQAHADATYVAGGPSKLTPVAKSAVADNEQSDTRLA